MVAENTVPLLLEMRNVSKTFGPIKALKHVDLQVCAGEIHALMGENGAGKSTLMKVLSGAYRADRGGEIYINGVPLVTGDLAKSRAMGIAVIYQELSLAPNLNVAQNIYLGYEKAKFGILNRGAAHKDIQLVLDRLGVTFSPDEIVGNLSLGERQMVEIARALTAKAKIIIMDEPTTSLSSRETEKLFEVVAQLKSEAIGIIYISHRMEEIYRLSDRVSVLRDGAYIGTLEKDEINADRLVSMMVGRDLSSFYTKDHTVTKGEAEVVLSVRHMGDGVRVHDCCFEVKAGEVLGVSGLIGSGRTELARLIFAGDTKTSGEVYLRGKKLDLHSPSDAMAAGIAYLTEDRKGLGLFLDMSVEENINISVMAKDAHKCGIVDFSKAHKRTARAVDNFSIRAASASMSVSALSGGNQQKVLLARLLETKPQVVILDEPTRGVDVGAKSEIYRIINDLAAEGIVIVIISSDLPELIGISDRIMVMREGHIAGEVRASEQSPITQEAVMALSTGPADHQAA